MGITYAKAKVTGSGRRSEVLDFLVDSGAQYTLLPEAIWKRLRLKPKRSESFRLVDGTVVERPLSECVIEFAGKSGHTPVILGQPGDDQPLLGVVTLEELGLILHPFNRQLLPMQLFL
jgi:predicted aspartyl protease